TMHEEHTMPQDPQDEQVTAQTPEIPETSETSETTTTASAARIAANRANARHSTGPRTVAGKAIAARNAAHSTGPRRAAGKRIAARNALVHGMWASADFLLEGEDREQWVALQAGLDEVFAPQGTLEEFLVERIARAVWRMRRLQRVETSMHTL